MSISKPLLLWNKMYIGFYRDALIGDNLVALNAIYAIKALYPACKLIVYTNTIGIELYSRFDFIDELINMDLLSKTQIQTHINQCHFDFFILTQANRWRCQLINQTNAKQIISLLSLGSIFKPKFKTLFISRNLSPMPQYQRMLKLIRAINPAHFDAFFPQIDFSPIRLKPQMQHQNKIQAFFAQYPSFHTFVMLNPFSRTCSHNLTLQGWLTLTQKLAALYPQILFIIPTYEGNPQSLELPCDLSNIAIFKNDKDLFNLVELTQHLSLLISPSTGNAHIANNLKVPLLGLFSKRDRMLWRGENMDLQNLILVPTRKEKMSKTMENVLIAKIIEKFKEIFK